MSGDDWRCPHECVVAVPRVPLNWTWSFPQTPIMDLSLTYEIINVTPHYPTNLPIIILIHTFLFLFFGSSNPLPRTRERERDPYSPCGLHVNLGTFPLLFHASFHFPCLPGPTISVKYILFFIDTPNNSLFCCYSNSNFLYSIQRPK